jgi:hypothetical protein
VLITCGGIKLVMNNQLLLFKKGMTTTKEAGYMGGLVTLERYGRPFYSVIGRVGQRVTRRKYPGMASIWGKMGGRPMKHCLAGTNGEGNVM